MTSPTHPSFYPYLSDKKIITVSGSCSGVGKTLLAEYILSLVKNFSAIKITIEDFFTAVTADDESIMVPGKDTFRLKTAGADKVIWVKSSEENLVEAMQQALSLCSSGIGLLIEGNSIIAHLSPDIGFFVSAGSPEIMKSSRIFALQKAHVIINNIRDDSADDQGVEKALRRFNLQAAIASLNLKNSSIVLPFLLGILKHRAGDAVLRGAGN